MRAVVEEAEGLVDDASAERMLATRTRGCRGGDGLIRDPLDWQANDDVGKSRNVPGYRGPNHGCGASVMWREAYTTVSHSSRKRRIVTHWDAEEASTDAAAAARSEICELAFP